MKPTHYSNRRDHLYALVFGLFLGLAIWKFGNPVILDSKISAPATLTDFWNDAWPIHWVNYFFLPLTLVGAILIFSRKIAWPANRWLWRLPLAWLGWQLVSATHTLSADLTAATLWQFFGCVSCYFLGVFLFADKRTLQLLLAGLLLAFTFCLVRGAVQRNYEFPQNHQMLSDGERAGWTNFPPETVLEMKRENIIITTNGMDVANPVIMSKFAKGRVNGTLVYPNALGGLILLLLPVSLVLAFNSTRQLKPSIRGAAILMTIFLGSAVFYWTGSKLGWLIGIGLGGLFLLRLEWSKKLKILAVATILILGVGIFAIRFHGYFAAGATSVGARFDYWRAAGQTTLQNPVFGSGPGTFQLTYAAIKQPDAEMARLAHNDYLEQFCDSGVVAGVVYAAWIILALRVVGRKLWPGRDMFLFALFAGVFAWFVQGLGEFSLYIPALAWTTFTLLGSLVRIEPTQ